MTVSTDDEATVDVTLPRDDDWVLYSFAVAVPAEVSLMVRPSKSHSSTTLLPLPKAPSAPRLSSFDSHELSSASPHCETLDESVSVDEP